MAASYLAEAVLEAEGFRVHRAELRMIAAAALGDVVEQTCEIQDLRLLELLHDAAAVRELVIETAQRESPQVADHEQRVFIDRVGVEQVVLHAPDDPAEGRQVQAEHAVEIHAAQFVGHALGCPQDRQEQPVIARVLPELLVDEIRLRLMSPIV